MESQRLQTALQEAADTRRVSIGCGVIAGVADLFAQDFAGRSALVVARLVQIGEREHDLLRDQQHHASRQERGEAREQPPYLLFSIFR